MSSIYLARNNAPIQPFGKKKRKMGKTILMIFLLLIILFIVVHSVMYFLFVPKQPTVYPDLAGKRPLIIAHQGGELLAPSNTMAAFDLAYSLGADVLETDIHMTKDGHLVTIHDATVDRTTNGTGRVDQYTLEELQKLDAGYHFKDLEGNYSYRGKGVYIPTLEELFAKYGDKSYFNVEIKDSYPKDGESQIEKKLWELIQKYHLEKKVVVSAFNNELLQKFNSYAKGAVALGAGRSEVTKFVVLHKAFLPGFYRPQAQAIQIPTEDSGINLKSKGLIKAAHRLNMIVQYWTIDDKETMRELIELGADGIMTNRPDLLHELLEEMGYR